MAATITISDFTGGIFLFYLILSAGFQLPLFPCGVQRIFTDSQLLRHVLGFLTLMFLVILVNEKNRLPIHTLLLLSVGAYAWFMMTSKMTTGTWFAMILLLGGIFLLQAYIEHQEETPSEESKSQLQTVENIQEVLSYGVAILTVFGFVHYMAKKKRELGNQFSFGTFLLGNPVCRSMNM